MEQDKYIIEIVRLTKPLVDCINHVSGLLQHQQQQQQHRSDTIKITPITNRRRFTSKLEKAVQNFRPNFQNFISNQQNTKQTLASSSHLHTTYLTSANGVGSQFYNSKRKLLTLT
jgi:hypothetical protein